MSGFDTQMRTDQHIAQNRQFYDAQRYQAEAQTAHTIGQMPGMVQQAQANAQAMDLQQLQSEMMRAKMDSDLRAQEAATEQQFHLNKMNEMVRLDEVDLSRERVRGARIMNERAAFQMEQDRKNAQPDSRTSDRWLQMSSRIQDPRKFAEMFNGRVEVKDGKATFHKFTGDEKKKYLDSLTSGKGRSEDRHMADGARLMAESIASQYRTRIGLEWPDTDKGRADRARYNELMQQASSFYTGSGQQPPAAPGQAPPPAAPQDAYSPPAGTAPIDPAVAEGDAPGAFTVDELHQALPPKDNTPRLSQAAVQQANAGYMHAQRDPQWQQLSQNMGEESFARLLAGVGVAAEDLVKNGRMPPDRASQVVMQSIMQGGSESAYYMTMAGYSEPQIRAWLSSRGQSDSAVKAIMSRLNAHVAKRKGERK